MSSDKKYENEPPTCVACGDEYSMNDGCEPSYCDPCAQELVPELLEALEAESSLERRDYPTFFGHGCQWCEKCCVKVREMRRAAIEKAKGGKS